MSIKASEDGLIIPEVGQWAKRKYHFLHRYLDIFATGMKNKWRRRIYVDLFAGAGFARLRNSGELATTSALLAADVRDPFSELLLCEQDSERFGALRHRLTHHFPEQEFLARNADANRVVSEFMPRLLVEETLSLVFVDPYGLHFDFDTARQLSGARVDLIVLFADSMDALRNWATYYLNNPHSSLDRFMGESGWRNVVRDNPSSDLGRKLRERYSQRLQTLGFRHFGSEPVHNDQGTRLYTLMFASKHKTGLDFWHKASSVDERGQRSFSF